MTHGFHSCERVWPNRTSAWTASLPRDCAHESPARALDRIITRTSQVVIGEFRCPTSHPSFHDTGPIAHFIVVFPRTSVWIRHEGSARFLADPTIATIYNRGQRYERHPHAESGDRCDWFGVCDDLARDISAAFDVCARDSARPFAFEHAPTDAALYYRQRRLLARALQVDADTLEIEEGVIGIVESVLASAYRGNIALPATAPRLRKRRDMVDAARALLVGGVTSRMSLADIASSVEASPYHLCRAFHDISGLTMSEYRNELRVRLSLEMLDSSVTTRRSISDIAHELGFSSHSHYVTAMQKSLGFPPTRARAALRSTSQGITDDTHQSVCIGLEHPDPRRARLADR
jgi:AraC-like DNA-binding protein